MRIGSLLLVTSLAISACARPEAGAMSSHFESSASIDALATCISQNHEAAFPRFFSHEEDSARRVFKTYNGIAVAIDDDVARRRVTVSSPQALTTNQANYIRQCISMSEAA
ncbi:hypothetical protein [Sphingopyxis alaskensis]|nr:hypothetical protein [Sphingopyxis alaskensis]MCM3420417.1 hypothetical protein [Sphingopyxis alaskensis]